MPEPTALVHVPIVLPWPSWPGCLMEKNWPARRVTLPSQKTLLAGSHHKPTQLFVPHLNGPSYFLRKCMKSWLAQGNLDSQLTFLPRTTFHLSDPWSKNQFSYWLIWIYRANYWENLPKNQKTLKASFHSLFYSNFLLLVISSITVVIIPVFLGIHSFAVPRHMQVWLPDDSRSDPKGLTEAYWRILKLLLRG